MDAEAQLQLYLDRAREPKQKGFPPLEALSARLNEFTEPLHHAEASADIAPRQFGAFDPIGAQAISNGSRASSRS